jgi:hypothetical protein
MVVVVVGMLVTVVTMGREYCAHGQCSFGLLAYLLAATTSAGCTIWPVLFDQLFFV